jgi:hypothetical protein
VILSSDAAHANARDLTFVEGTDGKSRCILEPFRIQQGYVLCLGEPGVETGKEIGCYLMEWRSVTEKRVCENTLAAETYSLATAVQAADWMKALLEETRCRDFQVARWEEYVVRRRSHWLIDAKSVQDHLVRDTGCPSDKRLGIAAASLRQLLRRGGDDLGDQADWIDTKVQLADPMTKDMEATLLETLMVRSTYSLEASHEIQREKKRQAELQRGRKAAEKAKKAARAKYLTQTRHRREAETANMGISDFPLGTAQQNKKE